MQQGLTGVLTAREMPAGLPTPPGTEPPAGTEDVAVDDFLSDLRTLAVADYSHVHFGPFGPVPLANFRDFILVHSAHHLKHLRPTTP